jgi:uncharacterized RDD family membrane protein YckC
MKVDDSRPRNSNSVIIRRASAWVIDYCSLIVLSIIVVEFISDSPEHVKRNQAALLLFCLMILYDFIADYCWGGTIGKHAVGLRVFADHGNRINVWQALVRALFSIPELFIWYFSLYFVVSDRRGKRIGDLIARTYVDRKGTVKTRVAP